VRLLLDAGTNDNAQDGKALCNASSGGHNETVHLSNALCVASHEGDTKIASLSPERGAEHQTWDRQEG
jgi:hypothetical protein